MRCNMMNFALIGAFVVVDLIAHTINHSYVGHYVCLLSIRHPGRSEAVVSSSSPGLSVDGRSLQSSSVPYQMTVQYLYIN